MIVEDLPKVWTGAPLSEFAAGAGPTVNPQAYPDEVFDLYSVPAFENREPEVVSGNTIKSNKQAVRPGDVLLCKIVPHLNRVWVVGENRGRRQIASGEWVRYSTPAAEPSFLRHLLSSPEFREEFMTTVSGVGGSLMRARPHLVDQIDVPVPPLPEQRRIVAKLDRLAARSRTARDHLARVAMLAARAKQTILAAAYGGEQGEAGLDQNRVESRTRTLADICGRDAPIIYGILQPGPDQPDGIPYVRPTEIGEDGIDLDALRRTTSAIANRYRRSVLREGDILLSIVGTIGKVAVVPPELAGGNITQSSCRIRVRDPDVDPRWIAHFLRSPLGVAQFGENRLGTAVPRLNLEDVRQFVVWCPPLAEQRAKLAQIESDFARIDRLTAEAARAARLLDRLYERLLARAFRGELVAQDLADEPASALLDRVRATRVAAPVTRRGRRSRDAA